MQRLLTRAELAAYLGVCLSSVDTWRRAGKIPAIYYGRIPMFNAREVDQCRRK